MLCLRPFQSWLCSVIPKWLWISGITYINRIQRKRCLIEAMERRNGQLFARRKYSSVSGQRLPVAARRKVSELSIRRSPSPGRRTSNVENPKQPSPIKKISASMDPLRRISIEENGVFTPSRTSSSSSRISVPTIPETPTTPRTPDPARSSSPSKTMFSSSRGQPSHLSTTSTSSATADGGIIVSPRRSSSASSADSTFLTRRHTLPKNSRVLVLPSVARVSLSQSPEKMQNFKDGTN